MSDFFRAAIRPPSELTPPEWMAKHVRISNSERSAFFDIDQTPWWREPLELAADNSVHEIVIVAPTGSGKSTMAEGLCPYIVSEDPGPFLYASQTDPDAKFWVESRAMPAMKSCEALKHLWPQDRSKSRKTEIIWPHMPMVFGGANKSNFQEKSIRWGYGDEVWRWNPGLVREFLGRHHNRWNRRFYLVSQAGVHKDDLHKEFLKTDQAEWSWKCQECGDVRQYHRKDLKFDWVKVDGKVDAQASAETCRMVCGKCEHSYADTALNRRTLTNSVGYVSTAKGLKGYRGFHLHAFAIWWVPWADYVLELIAAKAQLDLGDTTEWRKLCQKRDAVPWKDDMAIERKDFAISERDKAAVDADPKAILPGETHRFMTVDKGGDHFWAVVRSWAPGGPSVQLFEGYIPGKGGIEPEVQAIQEKFGVKANHVFMDMSFEWTQTAELCAAHGWTGIRGEGEIQSFSHTPKNGRGQRTGKPVERLFSEYRIATGNKGGKCRYVAIASNPLKDILFRLANGKGMRWEVLPDCSKAYKRHMRAEVRKEAPVGKSKRIAAYWETTDRQNHLWDAEYYNVSAALMAGLFTGVDG